MEQRMETYYYEAVSASGFLTSQMIWWFSDAGGLNEQF